MGNIASQKRPPFACSCTSVSDSVSASANDSEFPSTCVSGDAQLTAATEGESVVKTLEAHIDSAPTTSQHGRAGTDAAALKIQCAQRQRAARTEASLRAQSKQWQENHEEIVSSKDLPGAPGAPEQTPETVQKAPLKSDSKTGPAPEQTPETVQKAQRKNDSTKGASQNSSAAPKQTKTSLPKSDASTNPQSASKKKDPQKQKKPEKMSILQRQKLKKAEYEAKREEMGKLVDDIVAGKYKKDGGGQPAGNMLIKMPTPTDRANNRIMILEHFRAQYKKIGRNDNCPSAPTTNQYTVAEQQGLKIEGGHRSMPRPTDIKLTKDFRKPIGQMNLKTLQNYNCENQRMLVSVYGDIFDVSDRPDKYATDGPYSWMSGHDITWGFVSGKDVPETIDHCYDLWKVAPEPFRDSKLKLIYAWVAFYEFEYGGAVGRLDLYDNEAALKGPPMEESEDCCIM